MAHVPAKRIKLRGPATPKYEVGYGKPPAQTQFKPGRSGNPAGRPKGARNKMPALNEERLKSIVLEEAYRAIRINDGDKQIKVPMAQAIVRAVAVNAVKGQQRAQRLFTELLTTTERENKAVNDEWLDVAMTYKIEWDKELERRKRLGITDLPDPLPHPDHVVLDMKAGTAYVQGPSTKDEKQLWDIIQNRKVDFVAELRELEALRDDPECPQDVLLNEIASTKKVLTIIEGANRRWGRT